MNERTVAVRIARVGLAIAAGLVVNSLIRMADGPGWAALAFGWVTTWQWYFHWDDI